MSQGSLNLLIDTLAAVVLTAMTVLILRMDCAIRCIRLPFHRDCDGQCAGWRRSALHGMT